MFALYADKTKLTVCQKEPLTAGSVNIYTVQFTFSADWDGLACTAVFKGGGETCSVPLDETGMCRVPGEVLRMQGSHLEAGVYGVCGEETVLPTRWADLGPIFRGAAPGGGAPPLTLELLAQRLAGKGDALDYDGLNLSLMSGAETLSTVQVMSGVPGPQGPAGPQGEPGPAGPKGDTGAAAYSPGHGLAVEDGKLTVVTADDFTGDNTLPMTAAGVQTVVGNIDVLLGTI